ncbi:MAG: hypothetical protein E7513_07160 [Ruminococcaceae bacterium]|nr:hypothetical protein [Oscillospiraceae bacterium]
MKTNILKRSLSLLLALMCLVGMLTVSVTSTAAVESDVAATAEASNAEPITNEYKIVTPVPLGSSIKSITQAARLDTLQGKTIALVGGSFSASVTHAVLRDMLEEEFGCKTYYMEEIGKGGTYNPLNPSDKAKEFQQKLKDYGVDAVISGNCGCGICTVKETGNAIAAEYIGIPAVVVGAETFIPQIKSTGYNRGVPVIRTAAYPGAFANDETAVQQQKARDILYDQVVTGLTTQIEQAEIDEIAGAATSANYNDTIFTGSYQRVQEFYEVSEMSDGLPVVPPTNEKVEYYLQFTNMGAEEIVNMKDGEIIGVKPAYREITAYQVAVNAIMSGCPAEYMPICMAITRCFANGNFYKSLDSTHGWTPYVLISGPLARQLGISYGDGMINEEANKLIGRFISLAMLNLAGYKIKENRMGTFGYMQPFCFAEDEQTAIDIGWDPYHVNNGFELNDSVITCGSTLTWGNPVTVGTTDSEKAMQLLAWDVTEKQQNGLGNTNPVESRTIWMTKDVAETIAKGYNTRDTLEDALIETARRPLWMRTYAHYWANTGSKIHMNTTFDEHYEDIKSGASTENVGADKVATTAVPQWLTGVVPYDTIDTTQTINENTDALKRQKVVATGFVVTGGDKTSEFQVMPGGDCVSYEAYLPSTTKWNNLMSGLGYNNLSSYNLSN